MSAATDGLSSDSLLSGARVGDAFSGSAARTPDDPDAPIATGRWAEDAAPIALAGGPQQVQAAVTPPEPIRLSRAAPMTDMPRLAQLELPAAGPRTPLAVPLARIAFSSAPQREAAPEPRLMMTISDQSVTAPGAGLDVTSNAFNQPMVSLRHASPVLDIKRLALRLGPSQRVGKKGRWFVFAAGSGKAFGLNLLRDPLAGWKPAGWSVEQLAEFGKAQLGIGWRKDSRQLAISAARREIGAYGISREDTVFGVTFTVSGRGESRVRREQRLPRAY